MHSAAFWGARNVRLLPFPDPVPVRWAAIRPAGAWAAVALLALVLALQAPARAADVLTTHRLSSALAMDIVNAAVAACAKMTYAITATVVDIDGIPQALVRADGAGIHTVQTAQDKAYTAVTYGRSGSQLAEAARAAGPPVAFGVQQKAPRLIIGNGGLPIRIGNELVGGLGISGSPGKDEDCGNAALEQLRGRLR
jgi:uncharacterized protein GlcG (DUF336 family)